MPHIYPHVRPRQASPNLALPTGLIIAASVIVAAGIAIYESPHVRQWVDQSRRKLAVALHTLGEEIDPARRNSHSDNDDGARRRKREELIQRNRAALIRRAREEGIAVDLDELARIGREEVEMTERTNRARAGTHASSRSFDDLVGTDGKLKNEDASAHKTTALETADDGLRRRGQGLGGFRSGVAIANPFDDEAGMMSDRELIGPDDDEAVAPNEFTYIESRHDTRPTTDKLIDLTPEGVHHTEASTTWHDHSSLNASHELPAVEQEPVPEDHSPQTQSFYSASSTSTMSNDLRPHSEEPEPLSRPSSPSFSTGTLTPRSTHSADFLSTNVSVIGSQADDIAILSMQNDDDHDARSEIFSEGGFSEFAEERRGVMTPSSWTDVGSDDESEFGGAGVQGTIGWGQSTVQQ